MIALVTFKSPIMIKTRILFLLIFRYTVLCSTRLSYLAPKTKDYWPKCVKSCWRKLPPVPPETGLSQRWVRPNKIPAGQYGQYRCIDTSLGLGPYISSTVNEKGGPRNFYRYQWLITPKVIK